MLTKKEVAERLNMSTRTINRLMEKKAFPYHKVGKTVRFDADDIEEYLRSTKQL